MATVKRVSSEYKLQTTAQNITLDTEDYSTGVKASIIINGNLIVSGNTSQVNSTNLTVTDNVVTLNSGETGFGVTAGSAGIEVDRGAQPTVELRWFEPFQKWQITTDGFTYANIATVVSGNYITSVVEDLTPQLGGNLDVNGFSIGSSNPNYNVAFSSPLQVTTMTSAPSVVNGETLIYAAASAGGGTGLYIASTEFQHHELISKKKALVYSLIF